MVIDDDPQVCRLLGSILENEGAHVVLKESAQQGLSALKSRPVDVLFTDLRVGDGDGLAIIAEARKLCPDLSTVVITGYGSVESSVGALRLGAVDYLTKPFRAEQVAQALARACSRVARRAPFAIRRGRQCRRRPPRSTSLPTARRCGPLWCSPNASRRPTSPCSSPANKAWARN